MAMLSYAQNGEDVILRRLFPEREGFYIDVGANDPVVNGSVTAKHFHTTAAGEGVNVEPEPAAFARMMDGRPRDINLNMGVSEQPGFANGLQDAVARERAGVDLLAQAGRQPPGPGHRRPGSSSRSRSATLAEVCERHAPRAHPVPQGRRREPRARGPVGAPTGSRSRPRAIPRSRPTGWLEWEPPLLAAGYHFGLFDGINRFYVRDEDRHFLPMMTTMAKTSSTTTSPVPITQVIHIERKIQEGNEPPARGSGATDDLQGRRRRARKEILEPSLPRPHVISRTSCRGTRASTPVLDRLADRRAG